jgi:hypothetical protein
MTRVLAEHARQPPIQVPTGRFVNSAAHQSSVDEPVPVATGQSFNTGLTAATSVGLSPRWVQYSGVSPAACKLAEVLTDLNTMASRVDQPHQLDREFLAYIAGFGRADKLPPYLRELQDIGFLTVLDGGTDPVTGKRRQRRGQDGRPLPDFFRISLEPPPGYVGPRNLTEVQAQFEKDRNQVYEAVKKSGKDPRVGRHAIPRTKFGCFEAPQVTAVPDFRGQTLGAVPGSRGQDGFAQVTAVPGNGGQTLGAVPGSRGQDGFAQVTAVPDFRGLLQIDQRSSISEREIEGSTEPVPGGTAEPPATGLDERHVAAVRELVRRLPWTRWANHHNRHFVLSPADADAVQKAMCSAISTAGVTLDQVGEIGRTALGEAKTKPVKYVIDAFGPTHLTRRLRALDAEPLSDNPLPLPGDSEPGNAPATRTKPVRAKRALAKQAELADEKCEKCGCAADDPKFMRRVDDPDGRARWCPVCVPNEAG